MSKIEKICSKYTHTIQLLAFLVAIIGLFFVFDNYINNQIEDKITSEEYMSNLSKLLRPFLVFDEKGNTFYDHGAKVYISDIDVDTKKEVILVKTKEYLQFAPLITFIGSSQYSYNTKRISDNTWSYTLESANFLVDGDGKESNILYVLEILK